MTASEWLAPLIFNVYKPPGLGSFDVVRHFKRNLPKGSFGKIGHFGTLDPFACGVLMVGVGGAARLNELVHAELPKTYVAKGILGIEKDTGDLEGKTLQEDASPYLTQTISQFDVSFVEKLLRDKFLGQYWQAPHQFSAAKYEGRALHQWARDGIQIKKEKVERFIHSLEVVSYQFPYLTIRVKVSSGTYIRTLFSEISNLLGTVGHLVELLREEVGTVHSRDSLMQDQWIRAGDSLSSITAKTLTPDQVLPYPKLSLREQQLKSFLNGVPLPCENELGPRVWVMHPDQGLMGLARRDGELWKTEINFAAAQASLQAERNH